MMIKMMIKTLDLPTGLVVLVAERVALAVYVRIQTELLALILVFDLFVQRVYRFENTIAYPFKEAHGVRLLHTVTFDIFNRSVRFDEVLFEMKT